MNAYKGLDEVTFQNLLTLQSKILSKKEYLQDKEKKIKGKFNT